MNINSMNLISEMYHIAFILKNLRANEPLELTIDSVNSSMEEK